LNVCEVGDGGDIGALTGNDRKDLLPLGKRHTDFCQHVGRQFLFPKDRDECLTFFERFERA
jgi:hypothetical protein